MDQDEQQNNQPNQDEAHEILQQISNKPDERSQKLNEIVKKKSKQQRLMILVVAVIGVLLLFAGLKFGSLTETEIQESQEISQDVQIQPREHAEVVEEESVDYSKLPLGEGLYANSPKKGYVYSCSTTYNGGGADTYGPWIDQENKTWDLTKKTSVDGDVQWPTATWIANTADDLRYIESKDLPVGHTTGIYPIEPSDDAYQYDKNPNSISEQSIMFEVPKEPKLLDNPECVGGEVGIAITGVLIFNAFDAAGRDAVAVEVQDKCQGHPQAGGYYHYHGYSSCFNDESVDGQHSDLLGYAFDGFGIYGLKGEAGVELSSEDLDVCHGHTHEIGWDGSLVNMYHYHMTQDFPYTVSCFRGEPSVKALSSGEGGGAPGGQQGPSGQGQQLPLPR